MVEQQVDTLIANASLHDRPGRWSVGIAQGKFAYVGQAFSGAASHSIDANGRLLLPGLLEPHTHIDKTYTWQHPHTQTSATLPPLRQAILQMQHIKASRQPEAVSIAARRALERAISFGVSHLRSHIDLGEERDLATVEQLLMLREEFQPRIHIEYTALGSCDSPAQMRLMQTALARGVDHVGGAPALNEDPRRAVAAAVDLAAATGKPLDLHIDETENPASPCLEYLAELVLQRDFKLPVLASHCCSLAFVDAATRARIADKVQAAGIHLISLPACNLVLMGRSQQPAPRGALPVNALLQHGIKVCAGSDNVGDPFQPWGDYDPLRSAALCAEVAHIDTPETAFALCSSAVASAFALPDYGIATGNRADCSLLEASSVRAALAESPLRSHVFFAGRLILQQQLQQQWS
jgi:cytosine/creatinine deaminase